MRTLKAVCLSLSVIVSPLAVQAETFLEGAKPFHLDPCPEVRKADPVPMPETMARGSDTRPTCQKIVRKASGKAHRSVKRHKKLPDRIVIHQK